MRSAMPRFGFTWCEELFAGVRFFKNMSGNRCGILWVPQWGGLLHPLTIVHRQFWFSEGRVHDLITTDREIRQSLFTVLHGRLARRRVARILAKACATCVPSEVAKVP